MTTRFSPYRNLFDGFCFIIIILFLSISIVFPGSRSQKNQMEKGKSLSLSDSKVLRLHSAIFPWRDITCVTWRHVFQRIIRIHRCCNQSFFFKMHFFCLELFFVSEMMKFCKMTSISTAYFFFQANNYYRLLYYRRTVYKIKIDKNCTLRNCQFWIYYFCRH